MAAKKLPDVEYLRQCFSYDSEMGVLTWRARPREHFNTDRGCWVFNGRDAGKIAGFPHANECGNLYVIVKINGSKYPAHRIIWALTYGIDPDGEVDHRDGNSLNNRLGNLRLATRGQNRANSKSRRDGLKGASFMKGIRKWAARIRHDNKLIYLGVFHTEAEAHAAYCRAAAELHGEFACTDR